MTEAELLHRAANGDEDAFQKIFYKYWGRVRYWVGHPDDPAAADDCAQLVFVRLWFGKYHVEPDPTFRSAAGLLRFWAYQAGAYYRQQKARETARTQPLSTVYFTTDDDDDTLDTPHSPQSNHLSPEQQAYGRELRPRLRRAFLALRPKARQIALMSMLQEYSRPEIAERLDIPFNTVSSALAAVRPQLQRRLADLHPLPLGVPKRRRPGTPPARRRGNRRPAKPAGTEETA